MTQNILRPRTFNQKLSKQESVDKDYPSSKRHSSGVVTIESRVVTTTQVEAVTWSLP